MCTSETEENGDVESGDETSGSNARNCRIKAISEFPFVAKTPSPRLPAFWNHPFKNLAAPFHGFLV
jgi:hypothetical protein